MSNVCDKNDQKVGKENFLSKLLKLILKWEITIILNFSLKRKSTKTLYNINDVIECAS